jgi:LmbE family N-acetylglucosaminyl deacetylase
MSDLALLGVFAHPDDEQLMSGVYAQAAADGIKTGLICATRGELGEIASPELATPENLGHVRENELRAACAVLGIKYLWFLDYRDSGMMGTIGNDDPGSFYRADPQEAVGKVVKIVRDFKPAVMVTFDPTGGYGHPDHITIYKVATAAFHAAGDPQQYPEAGEVWQPARLFYAGFPRGQMARFGEMLKEMGVEEFMGMTDRSQYGLDDATITNAIAVEAWLNVKERSLLHHRTQNNPNNLFNKFPREWIEAMRSTEHYALVAGTPMPAGEEAKQDLFAGLRN